MASQVLRVTDNDQPSVLVARYLKANNYSESLDAFIRESGLPKTAGVVEVGDLTLEKVLEEKRQYDAALAYEKQGDDSNTAGWFSPHPSEPRHVSSIPESANILSVRGISMRYFQGLCITTADRSLNYVSAKFPYGGLQ